MFDEDLIILFCWIAEALSLATMLATGLWVLRQIGNLPERLPVHFGFTGEVDSWGGKWIGWLMLGIQVSTYALITLTSGTSRLVTGVPINKPSALLVLTWVKLLSTILVFFLTWTIIRVGRGDAKRLNMIVVFGLTGLMVMVAVLLPKL